MGAYDSEGSGPNVQESWTKKSMAFTPGIFEVSRERRCIIRGLRGRVTRSESGIEL